jgi:Uma2 family endonuclease
MGVCTCDDVIRIPAGITDHESFRRWVRSADLSRDIKVSYLDGEIWIEAPDTTGKGLHIPAGITDHESFRRWARSGDIPENVRVCYLDGDIWVDLSMEQLYVHNRAKTRISTALDSMTEAEDLGQYFSDGVLLSHRAAQLTTVPDGVFVTYDALRAGRIRRVEGVRKGYVELEGTPDMVLEVVSDSSVHKDTVELRRKYWRAGILEYWLVDVRGEPPQFDLLRRGSNRYARTRRQADGWLRSEVFGRSFRLTQTQDRIGDPQYKLEVRP